MKTADEIHIVPFAPELREHFVSLNKEWIGGGDWEISGNGHESLK
jgi:hypothetical protein